MKASYSQLNTLVLAVVLAIARTACAFVPQTVPRLSSSHSPISSSLEAFPQSQGQLDRRHAIHRGLGIVVGVTGLTNLPAPSSATGLNDGNLPDLPAEAVRSYLQYRAPLQTSADFYLFDFYDVLSNPSEWGTIGELFQSKPNRIEREFTNVMRVVGLSMPPEESEEMREAQYDFEKAMAVMSKTTLGIRRDLPVELDPNAIPTVAAAWDDGRIALNKFLTTLNSVTGMDEMKTIPPPGPTQLEDYGRSRRKYLELKKKIKLCQNRGGPTLSVAWGQLMVSGYLQDSCGIPDLDAYFYQ